MKIFYDPATGQLRGYRKSEAEELQFAKPAGVSEIEIDETVNATVVSDLDADYQSHDVVAGVLRKNSVAVTIQPQSTDRVNLVGFRTEAAQAIADNQTFINLASPSNAQNAAQIKALTRQMNRVIRLMLRLNSKRVI